MPFPYYARLSLRQQAIYRASDRIGEIRLPHAKALAPAVEALRASLAEDDRRGLAAAAQHLSRLLLEQLNAPLATVKVQAVRPSRDWGELHGLYTADEDKPAEIRLWMRTAHQGRVVAFRTFLRTLLHELCHHLDYQAFKLADSFHTQGFFRRESSLFRQTMPEGPSSGRGAERAALTAPAPVAQRANPGAGRRSPGRRAVAGSQSDADRQGRLRFDADVRG